MKRLFMQYKVHFLIYSALLLMAAYSLVARISESNWVCGSCHGDLQERWAHSTHKEVNCRSCHIEPGAKGQLKAHTDGLRNLWVSVTKGNEIQPHEDPVPIKTAQCMACHAGVLYVNELGYNDLPENSLKGQGAGDRPSCTCGGL